MTNGHRLASATRRPDGTILVHTLHAPLRRLRFAVYRRPLLRGLALLPTQIGDTIALLKLEAFTSQHPDPAQRPPRPSTGHRWQPGDPEALAAVAGLIALGWVLGGVASTQLTLSAAAALGGQLPWLPSILAAIGFAVRPLVRWRIAKRSAGPDLALLHGAEHQALNCVRRGWPLTDHNIAQSPAEAPGCDTGLKVTDQLIFIPLAVVVEVWLPGWPLWVQLAAGLGVYLAARPLAFELNTRQVAWQTSGRRHGPLGLLSRLGLRRQAKSTTRPGGPEHRELAARALAPLLPADQQALVGAFPSPVQTVSVPAATTDQQTTDQQTA